MPSCCSAWYGRFSGSWNSLENLTRDPFGLRLNRVPLEPKLDEPGARCRLAVCLRRRELPLLGCLQSMPGKVTARSGVFSLCRCDLARCIVLNLDADLDRAPYRVLPALRHVGHNLM